MPFIAIQKSTGRKIDISKIANPREVLKSGDCICQLCEQPMMIKAGVIIRHHFAHMPDKECQSMYKKGHPESPDHDFAKREVARVIEDDLSKRLTGFTVDYEVPIEEIKRQADVLVTFPMGWRIAHEVQLAKITIDELEERTNDYLRAGIDVFWWLGKSADTESNRTWCVKRFGFSFRINIVEQEIEDSPLSPAALI